MSRQYLPNGPSSNSSLAHIASLRAPAYRKRTWWLHLAIALAVVILLFGSLSSALAEADAPAPRRLDLGGSWERFIGTKLYDFVTVPSSYHPVGIARLHRRFNLPQINLPERVFLIFEGIAGEATVRINRVEVGRAHPWLGVEFDVTSAARTGDNDIDVEIADWQIPLGPNGAWEGYGGIIRDAYLEVRPESFIENARLTYSLDLNKQSAACVLDVFLAGRHQGAATLSAELRRDGVIVSQLRKEIRILPGTQQATFQWSVDHVALWSPQDPNLYDLKLQLTSKSGEHVFQQRTGFRALSVEGEKFLLNGHRLILKGIDRHDLWKDQGLTLTDAQIEQDMRMIKSMGANFVRLCCYPSDKRNLEWAGRLGLFVSEEAGLCWINFKDAARETVETGIENLEGEIKRDWNSPALFSVMFANESQPSVEVMREARSRVKALLPNLFISATDLRTADGSREATKQLFDQGGFDYYGYHAYTYDMDAIVETASSFTGKPLVFTEWGGPTGRLPIIMDETVEVLSRLIRSGRLAGQGFWEWADMPEFSREDRSMNHHGILVEGVVTEDRTVRPEVFARLANLYRAEFGPEPSISRVPKVFSPSGLDALATSQFVPISLQPLAESDAQHAAWQTLEKAVADYWQTNGFTKKYSEEPGGRFWTWSAPSLLVGPIPFETAVAAGETTPLVITPDTPIEIAVNAELDRLHILGNVTVPDGYPTRGRLGDSIGEYVVQYEDGDKDSVPLRWGYEIVRSNRIAIASRLNPLAAKTLLAVEYRKDGSREDYQTLLLTLTLKAKRISSVRAQLTALGDSGSAWSLPRSTGSLYKSGKCFLLLYAVTGERRASR